VGSSSNSEALEVGETVSGPELPVPGSPPVRAEKPLVELAALDRPVVEVEPRVPRDELRRAPTVRREDAPGVADLLVVGPVLPRQDPTPDDVPAGERRVARLHGPHPGAHVFAAQREPAAGPQRLHAGLPLVIRVDVAGVDVVARDVGLVLALE